MISEAAQDWRSRSTIKVEEAAPILGISRSSAYDAAHSGQIPTLRIGRRLLVPTHTLRQMLGEVPTNESSPAATGLDENTAGGISHEQSYSQ